MSVTHFSKRCGIMPIGEDGDGDGDEEDGGRGEMTLAGFLVCGRQKLMDNSRVVFSLPSVSLALPARRTTRGNDDGAAEDGHSLKMAGTPPETDGDRHMMHGPIRRRCRHLFNAHHWMQGVWPVSTTTVYYGVYRREVHVLLPVQTTVVTVYFVHLHIMSL